MRQHLYFMSKLYIPRCFSYFTQAPWPGRRRQIGGKWLEGGSFLIMKLFITIMYCFLFFIKVVFLTLLNVDLPAPGKLWWHWWICKAFLFANSAWDTPITVIFSAARMPRDNKTPLIQKIAKQAYITFKGLKSSANGDNCLVADKQSELISLVTAVRAADLKIAPRKTKPSSVAAGVQSPPVTYMHICETEVFSMGVFLLRSGASIPLHDHPDMNGMLKVNTWCLFFYGLFLAPGSFR